jgi:hypothetical protein
MFREEENKKTMHIRGQSMKEGGIFIKKMKQHKRIMEVNKGGNGTYVT